MALDPFAEFDEAGEGLSELANQDAKPAQAVESTESEPEPMEKSAEDVGEPEEEHAPDPEVAPRKEKAVPYDRFQDVIERNRALEARVDELMRFVLDSTARPKAPEPVQDDSYEIDPEAEKVIAPVLKKYLPEGLKELVEERARATQMADLEAMMPGIGDMWPQIEEEFSKLPREKQPRFDNPQGALALAGLIKARQASKPTASSSATAKRRAHTEATPAPSSHRPSQGPTSEQVKGMSKEQFAKYVESLSNRRSGRSTDEVDPLLR